MHSDLSLTRKNLQIQISSKANVAYKMSVQITYAASTWTQSKLTQSSLP